MTKNTAEEIRELAEDFFDYSGPLKKDVWMALKDCADLLEKRDAMIERMLVELTKYLDCDDCSVSGCDICSWESEATVDCLTKLRAHFEKEES